MSRDPLIEEMREARMEISRECDHDIWKLYAYYDAIQKQMKAEGKRFVTQPLAGQSDEAPTGTSD